jgi:SAM-dependent methyltransferase
MERVLYDHMEELDGQHWWYRGRRRILADLIRREVRPPPNALIFEIGCGSGHNLPMLAEFGMVDALELDEAACALAERRLGRPVLRAPLPELKGIPTHHYDMIGAFDVIEHVKDDAAALASIAARLKPGGKLVVTVPAHQWMWSAHDDLNHHERRYSKRQLRRLVEASPLRLDKIGYFNSFLFPLAVAERVATKVRRKESANLKLPAPLLNRTLEGVFAAERHFAGRLPLPPGLSLFAVASAT